MSTGYTLLVAMAVVFTVSFAAIAVLCVVTLHRADGPYDHADDVLDFIKVPFDLPDEGRQVLWSPASSPASPHQAGRGAHAQPVVSATSPAPPPLSPDAVAPPSREHDEGPDRPST
jgi:hypothetical protein